MHMGRRAGHELVVAGIGEDGDREPSVTRVGFTAYEAPGLEPLDQVGESGQRRVGDGGKVTHAPSTVRLLGETRQRVVLDEAEA